MPYDNLLKILDFLGKNKKSIIIGIIALIILINIF